MEWIILSPVRLTLLVFRYPLSPVAALRFDVELSPRHTWQVLSPAWMRSYSALLSDGIHVSIVNIPFAM